MFWKAINWRKRDLHLCAMFDTNKKWKAIESLLGHKSTRKKH